ncbi:YibE/F family protein [Sinanaerobacter sp. ZZT-01]|uniref:YibE/F family protein n=1 Tax=Sinanaerobacter sp. ZZT-01 TaxID=3111540 RepID=UPI002D76CCB5|nr:YibE/F family protein [Sinanaerobacter sp. ZZT-01]WRR92411.1 YibE/F family protein [Sinanaerobacter sp. ZZT-01]
MISILLLTGIVLVFHDYQWYSTPIVKITTAEDHKYNEAEGYHGEKETYYEQAITGIVMNGTYKGQEIQLKNSYSYSQVHDEKYKKGDEVFIQMKQGGSSAVTGLILGLKRDKYLAILFSVLILIILLTAKEKGLFVVLSLLANISVFWYALYLYEEGKNIWSLSIAMVLCFTILSLLLISGFNKKTWAAVLSTLICVWIMMLLLKIVMQHTSGVDYTFMEYVTSPSDLPEIFLSQILLGGLGAIMDVSITMSATINELLMRDNHITVKNLIRSGRELGHDIMGTMINVMLFTYICGSIPLIILKMKNEINLRTIVMIHMPFEVYRFLVGSIGILLAIPVALLISFLLLKRWRTAV